MPLGLHRVSEDIPEDKCQYEKVVTRWQSASHGATIWTDSNDFLYKGRESARYSGPKLFRDLYANSMVWEQIGSQCYCCFFQFAKVHYLFISFMSHFPRGIPKHFTKGVLHV